MTCKQGYNEDTTRLSCPKGPLLCQLYIVEPADPAQPPISWPRVFLYRVQITNAATLKKMMKSKKQRKMLRTADTT